MTKRNKPTDVFKYIDMSGGPDACWPWTGTYSDKKLPYFRLNGRLLVAYRLVYSLYNDEFPLDNAAVYVLHQCDNKGVADHQRCCNPRHMKHGTHQQNMDEMKERERHGLTAVAVKAIKRLLADTDLALTHEEIGKRFGVSRQTIGAIANGTTYKQIDGDGSAADGN